MSIPLRERLQAISELVSESGLLELVETIWEHDRQFTYPAFHATARKVAAKLREWNVRARTFELPADGKTMMGDWKMPLGWDCKAARLEIYEPFEERGQLLGDYKDRPCHVVMWSGPTPEGGITAEVIKIAGREDLEAKREQVKGKIVHTPRNPREFKRELFDAGAAALVTSYCRNAHHIPDACFWVNGWSDNPGGWAFHDGDAPLPGMVISPNAGVALDVLMDRGPVKLKMIVESSYMETTIPVVCGYLDAELQEEILAIGHAMEQGANDNASGCAVILESLRVLQEGTQSGRLPKLRRGVRGLLPNECYGTMGFAVQNPGIIRRIVAGINWDTVGRHQEDVDAVFKHHRCPDANASVADTLMYMLLDLWIRQKLPHASLRLDQSFSLTDNHYNDPMLNVPCVYVDSQDRYWHTSRDTMDQISGRTLHAFATVSAAYLHILATATAKEAMWLAQHTLRRYAEEAEQVATKYAVQLDGEDADKPAVLAKAFDHLAYVKEISDKALMSAKRFMLREERAKGHLALQRLQRHMRRLVDLEKRRLKELAGCEPGQMPAIDGLEADLATLRPFKKFVGTATYDSVPLDQKADIESPTWNGAIHAATFWSDGKLEFREIVRRVLYEYGGQRAGTLSKHFRFMGEHGLIQWLQPGEPVPRTAKLTGAAARSVEAAESGADAQPEPEQAPAE